MLESVIRLALSCAGYTNVSTTDNTLAVKHIPMTRWNMNFMFLYSYRLDITQTINGKINNEIICYYKLLVIRVFISGRFIFGMHNVFVMSVFVM